MKRIVHGSRLKGSNGQKITNNTNIYGIMGGLAPMKNISAATHRSYRIGHARVHQDIPLDPEEGLEYMLGDNPMGKYLLSKNPQCAGGVGKMAILAKKRAYTKSTYSSGELMARGIYDEDDDYEDDDCETCAQDDSKYTVRAWYKGLNVTNCGNEAAHKYCYKSPPWATDCFHFRGVTCDQRNPITGNCIGANVVYMLDQMFSPGYLDENKGGFRCSLPAPTAPPSCDLGYDSRYYDAELPAKDENGNNQYPTPIEVNQNNWLVLGGGTTDWTPQILKSLVTGGSVEDFSPQHNWTVQDINHLKTIQNKSVTWKNRNTFVPTQSGSLADATDYYKFNQSVIDYTKNQSDLNMPPNAAGIYDTIQHIGVDYEEGYKTFDTNGEIIPELSDDTTITTSPLISIIKALGYDGIIFDFENSTTMSTWQNKSPFSPSFLSNIFKTIKKEGLKIGVTCMQSKDFAGDFWNDETKTKAPFFTLYDRVLFSHIDLISPQYYDNSVTPTAPTQRDFENFQFIQTNFPHNEKKDGITIIPTIVSCGDYDDWEGQMQNTYHGNISYDGYAIWKPSCSNTPSPPPPPPTTGYACNSGTCEIQPGGPYTTISACQAACGGGGGGGGCPTSCGTEYVCAKWWPTNPCSCIRQDATPPYLCGDTPSKNYSCENNCKEDPKGSYSSQSECAAACKKYACNNNFCQQDPKGGFNSVDDCRNSGCGKGPVPQLWGCDQDTGTCTQSSSGTFITKSSCESNCGGGGGGGECSDCYIGSSGPCKDHQNNVCFSANSDGSCPPGTKKCP